ncbi:hypothetical protein [Devosia sp.]|uniref:hypothetical protein n=1 Tax=Devosia sp. TaxID=1871048 RepID=UPI002F0E36F1
MNWLPRPSLHEEAEAARLKRRADARAYLRQQERNAFALSSLGPAATAGAVDLTMGIAVGRIKAGINTRPKKLA